jgi:NDP-hexose-3-ketoreductase
MQILILGHSAIAKRRLLPALASLSEVSGIEVASARDPGAAFSDYETALAQSDAKLVYVSLVNSDHDRWAQRALESGRHVVVDKPAFLEFERAQRLIELSRERGLCLAEATVYTRHPQIDAIRELFAGPGNEASNLVAGFSFPPLDAANFRYQRNLGGGALNDLGPYAVSSARLFFRGRPDELECRVLATGGPDDVETAFSVMMNYPGGRSMVGQFGFTSAYRNRLSCLGTNLGVDVDRIFTTPEDFNNVLHVSRQGIASTIEVPAADCFALFMAEVIERIVSRDLEGLRSELLDDAFVLDWMRRSAGGS